MTSIAKILLTIIFGCLLIIETSAQTRPVKINLNIDGKNELISDLKVWIATANNYENLLELKTTQNTLIVGDEIQPFETFNVKVMLNGYELFLTNLNKNHFNANWNIDIKNPNSIENTPPPGKRLVMAYTIYFHYHGKNSSYVKSEVYEDIPEAQSSSTQSSQTNKGFSQNSKTNPASGICVIDELQTKTVKALVASTDYPVENADVKVFKGKLLKNPIRHLKADAGGYFEISNLPAGKYTLEVSYPRTSTIYVPLKILGANKVENNKLLKINLGVLAGVPCGGGGTSIMDSPNQNQEVKSALNVDGKQTSSPRQTGAKKTKIVEVSDNPQIENSYNRRTVIFNKPNAGKNQEVKIALANPCEYWQSKVDMEEPDADFEIDENNSENVLKAIDCLLQLEGNKKEGLFSGATSDNVSQTFPNASVEVCALYYVSYLFYQDWKHADAIALVGKDGSINSEESVKKAFESYKSWLKELKKTGLQKARAIRLDPLFNSGIKWY